jgi:hypothetical protein
MAFPELPLARMVTWIMSFVPYSKAARVCELKMGDVTAKSCKYCDESRTFWRSAQQFVI